MHAARLTRVIAADTVTPSMQRKTGECELAEDARAELESILTAVGNPLRRRILRAVVKRGARDRTSPRELAERLVLPLSNVSYHVRVLSDCGAVQLVESVPTRGSLEHFYSAADLASHPRVLAALGLGTGGDSDTEATD